MSVRIINAHVLEGLGEIEPGTVNTCVTSPPYWGLRDYGVEGQIGLEETPEAFVEKLAEVFRSVRDVLRDDGTLWLNLGDTYARDPGKGERGPENMGIQPPRSGAGTASQSRTLGALKPKDLVGIPWRVAFALQADGWYLRSDIIWSKPNPMPESVTDRPTKAHEYLFLLSKSPRYYYDADAIKEAGSENPVTKARNGRADKGTCGASGLYGTSFGQSGSEAYERKPDTMRNRRTVWTVPPDSYKEAHFATFPPDLIRPCILAGCPQGGLVLDPFAGSGTTGKVSEEEGRNSVLVELNPEYCDLIWKRTAQKGLFT